MHAIAVKSEQVFFLSEQLSIVSFKNRAKYFIHFVIRYVARGVASLSFSNSLQRILLIGS